MNEIKMQNERIGIESEALNIETAWGGNYRAEEGVKSAIVTKKVIIHLEITAFCASCIVVF